MIANNDKCADKDKSVCDYNEFRRLRYFHGMLLDDKELLAEQEYHAGKRRLLNRTLHGSGVVCGLDLVGEQNSRWIEVTSGLALDCSGNEIWVPQTKRIDLTSLLPPKEKPKQPECKDPEETKGFKSYYIGIRYEEKATNPVSVYLPSGSCEERTCENSRYKEGYCVEIVECCPEKYPDGYPVGVLQKFCECDKSSYVNEPDKAKAKAMCSHCDGVTEDKLCKCLQLEKFCEQSVPCAECCSCDKPCYVVLGMIKVDEAECRLQSVCINECRRYVITGRLVQHLIVSVLTGAEKYFNLKVGDTEFQIKDAGELAQNPIKALCDIFRTYLIEGTKPEIVDCRGSRDAQSDSEVIALRERVAALEYKQTEQAKVFEQALQKLSAKIEPPKTPKKPASP